MATTTEEILVSDSDNSRKPSERLTVAIKECASGFKRLRDNINDAIEIGKIEGYTTKEVGDMIRQELANNQFSDRSIRRYLPGEAKMQSKVRGTNLRTVLTANANANIKPADYQSQDLPKYTKQFLIEVIRYLEEKQATTDKKSVIHEIKSASMKPSNINSNRSSNRRRTNKRLPKDKIQTIREMRAKGMSSRQIFATTGIARTTIVRYWK